MDQTTSLLEEELLRLGRALPLSVVSQLVAFVELLGRWGQQINLTSQPDPQAVIQRHLPDALVLSAAIAHRPLVHAVDVGSGAGLPGLALAILCPQLQLTLVEPRARRAAFLRAAVHSLQLTASVRSQKIETLPLPLQDLACSRATFAPDEWLRVARPLVSAVGLIAVFVARVERLPSPPGLALLSQIPYQLADGAPRVLALYQPMVSRGTPT